MPASSDRHDPFQSMSLSELHQAFTAPTHDLQPPHSKKLPLYEPLLPAIQADTSLKSQMSRRWLVLCFGSMLMIGNAYCYDNPAALVELLRRQFASEGQAFAMYYEMLYSVYSAPNVFLPLLGGLLVDRVGVLFSLNLFSILVMLGQLLFAAGVSASSLQLMLLGRIVFGLGGEAISVAQSAIISQWFVGKEIAMALGINLSFSRLGSVVNNQLSPWIARQLSSVSAALWVGELVCMASFCACLALGVVDRRATREIRRLQRQQQKLRPRGQPRTGDAPATPPAAAAAEDRVSLTDVRQFGRAFWLLSICCVSVYSAVLPFNSVLLALLQDRDFFPTGSVWRDAHNRTFVYGEQTLEPPGTSCASPTGKGLEFCKALVSAQQQAALVMSEPYTMSAVLSPVLGLVVDQYGGRAYHLLASQCALMLTHLLLGLTYLPAVFLLVGVGIGYSTFAAVLWPSVPLVVAPSQLGTAYGVLTSLQNLGLCLTPLIVGHVFESTHEATPQNPYRGVSLVFAAFAGVGVLAALALLSSKEHRRVLNKVSAKVPVAAEKPSAGGGLT